MVCHTLKFKQLNINIGVVFSTLFNRQNPYLMFVNLVLLFFHTRKIYVNSSKTIYFISHAAVVLRRDDLPMKMAFSPNAWI